MAENRNIVVLGGSFGGLMTAHYTIQHLLPSLNAKKDARYKVYLISPSSDFYFRIASPRVATSTKLMPAEKIFFDLHEGFKRYPENEFSFIQAPATGLDPSSRTVFYKRSEYLGEESLTYHALVVATGSRTFEPAYSQSIDKDTTLNAIKSMNRRISSAKDVLIVGGGPTGVEHAGELGELLNGKPGWFSTPTPKANITLVTASNQLLNPLRPAIGKIAEEKLKKLGVNVLYNTRVANHTEGSNGRTTVTLAKGDTLEVDVYVDAHGVQPNSEFLPETLLTDKGYLKTNSQTLRVEKAGPRVYSIGDVASFSRNKVLDIYDAFPVLVVNMRRDLLSYNAADPGALPVGKDRVFKPNETEMMIAPIGSAGGVGAIFGWKVPNWFVWLIKSRDFMISMGTKELINGEKVKKEIVWTKEEAVY
ncbi:hypothetical protein BDV96DRAFT_153492 [Lophiotrema nucula]|uniref:FAD/NAD(P)-binding domain-containing protein n=1 Tax=Lophiotrema nucula TaxID=690887 RepID=A0A6A5Z0G2_9PLEO|nr:hypothetical protein BDV96DRAFT_153492 [Lophiotrema nucula]